MIQLVVLFFFTNVHVLLDKENMYRYVQIQIRMGMIHGQMSPPSCTKAPEEKRNYIEDPGPGASRSRQKHPPPAAVKPSPAAVVEEEALAFPDLEVPHHT
jgi:hypothetical protein